MRGPARVTEGQVWTFVTLDGKRVDYRIDWTENHEAPQAIVKIVNVATGGVGWVTNFWLRRETRDRRGWFVYDQSKQPATPVAA